LLLEGIHCPEAIMVVAEQPFLLDEALKGLKHELLVGN
jgi:hypothetical protein